MNIKLARKIALTLFVTISIHAFSILFIYSQKSNREVENLRNSVKTVNSKLEYTINSSFIRVYSLATYISIHPDLDNSMFESLGEKLIDESNIIKNFVAAPNYIMTYIYPFEENKNLLGVDYRDIPDQFDQVEKAVEENKMILAGPLNLIQGGQGVIARVPVYEYESNKLWGLVSSVIDYDKLIDPIIKFTAENKEDISIFDNLNSKYILGDESLSKGVNSVTQIVNLPDRSWELTISSTNPVKLSILEVFLILLSFILLNYLIISRLEDYEKNKEIQHYNSLRNRDFISASLNWIWETDNKNNFIFSGGRLESILFNKNITSPGTETISLSEFFSNNSEFLNLIYSKKSIENKMIWIKSHTGQKRCLLTNAVTYYLDNVFSGYRGVCVDITDDIINESIQDEYIYLIDKYIPISQTDLKGVITKVNSAYCNLTGYTEDELIGNNHRMFRPKDVDNERYKNLWETISQGNSWEGILENEHKSGRRYWFKSFITEVKDIFGNKVGYLGVNNDITAEIKLEELSITDQLTGLNNRRKLDEILQRTIDLHLRSKLDFSLIILDIDHFKNCNDTFGHLFGDYILKQFSSFLKENIRKTDTIGRWGGEEFLIICPDTKRDGAVKLAENLRSGLEKVVLDKVGTKTASFGVASTSDNLEPNKIIQYCDDALYVAKSSGRNQVKYFLHQGETD